MFMYVFLIFISILGSLRRKNGCSKKRMLKIPKLNDALRIVTKCLRTTPTYQLQFFQVSSQLLCRLGATLFLANHGILNPNDILYVFLVSPDTRQKRLRSRPVIFNRDAICVLLECRKLLHTISMFLNLCAAKNFGKNYSGTSNFAVFAREISEIRSKDHFYLERTDFGKETDKKVREFR